MKMVENLIFTLFIGFGLQLPFHDLLLQDGSCQGIDYMDSLSAEKQKLEDHWSISGSKYRQALGVWVPSQHQDAVFTGVQMCGGTHVTRVKESSSKNSKNSIKQEDKQLLIKNLFCQYFHSVLPSYFEISFDVKIYIYILKFFQTFLLNLKSFESLDSQKFSFLVKDMTDLECLFSYVSAQQLKYTLLIIIWHFLLLF